MKSTPPEDRFLNLFAQFALHINNLQTFHGTTIGLLENGRQEVENKFLKAAKEGIVSPEIQELLGKEKCELVTQNEALFDFLIKSYGNRSIQLSSRMVGVSTLVFAHTILDELFTECCNLSFEAAPLDWYSVIDKRKIEIDFYTLRSADSQEFIKQKAAQFFREDVAKKSMKNRLNFLNRVCASKLNGEKPMTALIDMEKLGTFDQLRHRIVHGEPFTQKISEIEEMISFVYCTGIATLLLVGKIHKFFAKGNFTKEAFLSKVISGVHDDIPEYKELISALEKLTNSLKQSSEQLRTHYPK